MAKKVGVFLKKCWSIMSLKDLSSTIFSRKSSTGIWNFPILLRVKRNLKSHGKYTFKKYDLLFLKSMKRGLSTP